MPHTTKATTLCWAHGLTVSIPTAWTSRTSFRVPLRLNSDPRNGQPYFNTSLFSLQPLGEPGNVARRLFYGPGMANFDMALLKDLRLGESGSLQFRLEAFNIFNHAQSFGPAAVNANITGSASGRL